MITIDATGATSGIDFEAYIRGGFLADVGFTLPKFDNGNGFSGEEMMFSYGSTATSKYALAHGEITYDFYGNHQVYGTINTIELGTRGSGSYDSDGYFSGGNVELKITGLDLFNPQGSTPELEESNDESGPVNNFSLAYLYGSTATEHSLDVFGDALDTEAQHFKGSAYNDIFVGTAFDDVIEGNDGDDTLAGNGGNDRIDGGAGSDTVVFGADVGDAVVRKYEGGLVTVTVGGETTRVRNGETLDFADQDIATAGLDEIGRIKIDASAMGGVDFTTYLADYFASVQANGSFAFHGGAADDLYYAPQLSIRYRDAGDTTGDFTHVAIMEGMISYDFLHYGHMHEHSLSGTVDGLVFGTITGDPPATGTEAYTDYAAEIVISGLDIFGEIDAGTPDSTDPLPTIYYALTGGDASAIAGILAGYGQEFVGSAGADKFVGGDFDDLIGGGRGTDKLKGGDGIDVLSGDAGNDMLFGGLEGDFLFGGAGKDTLRGNEGDDYLHGGKGKDVLYGGAGADTFVFEKLAHSSAKKNGWDVIRDFKQDQGDKLDFSGFSKPLDFIGKDGFSGDGNEIRYAYKNNKTTLVKIDLDGDARTDMKIKLDGKIALTDTDFVL